ncbi:MAG TPA: DUF167 domain-containing protein [bacterium]|nr:DUF167 domain-containing protein [bacterium]
MRITVYVTPRAGKPRVERRPDGTWHVAVSVAPHDGEANDAVAAALAEHFGVARGRVRVLRGLRNRHKIIEVDGGGFAG